MNQQPRKLRPSEAAKILGSNSQAVRLNMQRGNFVPSIGTACLNNGSSRFAYEIYPERLADYLHISLDELFKRLED